MLPNWIKEDIASIVAELLEVEGRNCEMLLTMSGRGWLNVTILLQEFSALDYDLLSRNCCHFADTFCRTSVEQ